MKMVNNLVIKKCEEMQAEIGLERILHPSSISERTKELFYKLDYQLGYIKNLLKED